MQEIAINGSSEKIGKYFLDDEYPFLFDSSNHFFKNFSFLKWHP